MKLNAKRVARHIYKVMHSRYFSLFINGYLAATLLYLSMEDNYEKQLFNSLARSVRAQTAGTNSSEEGLLLQCLHEVYAVGRSRSVVFGYGEKGTLKSFIHPLSVDLMTVDGACESYASILSRLLGHFGVTNRIGQMEVNGNDAGHMVVEAKVSYGWVVLDPSFNLCFKKTDGRLASFAYLHKNWNMYANRLPAGYNKDYRYEGVRYTNWNKIPLLMPLLKQASYLLLGKERTEGLCLRTLFLRKYHILFMVSALLYVLNAGYIIHSYWKRNKKQGLTGPCFSVYTAVIG